MSPFFDDLEQQLREAAHAHASGERAARRRPRIPRPRAGWLSAVPIAIALASTAAVVAIALLVIPHRGSGAPGRMRAPSAAYLIRHTPKRQLQRELGYISKASAATRSAPACSASENQRTRVVSGTPSAALLSALPVLRTRATAADAPRGLLSLTGENVLRGATRLVLDRDGISYYVIPTRIDPAVAAAFMKCSALERRALRTQLAGTSPTVRADALRLQAAVFAYVHRTEFVAGGGTFCTAAVQRGRDTGTSYSCGLAIASLRSGAVWDTAGHDLYIGLVPNTVASVTLSFGSRSYSGRVSHNAFAIRAARGSHGQTLDHGTIWRAADGRVIKDVRVPRTSNLKAWYCSRHPVACLIAGSLTSSESSGGSGTVTTSAPAK